MTIFQMFRKGKIRPGCLVKCVKDVGVDKAHRVFVKGRPYRVMITNERVMILKSEGGFPVMIKAPTRFKRDLTTAPWTSFKPVNAR